MILNKVLIGDAEIKISHEMCTDPSWCQGKDIFIESISLEKNTLSTICFNDDLNINIFWESHASAKALEVLYVPETGVLFFGCGDISARVDTKNSKLIDLNYIALFWYLDRHKNFVLEIGELQCFLYDLDGKKISEADVDPPYEMEILEDGIKFESIVCGTTWLRYE